VVGCSVRGGGETVVDAPLELIPVWVRAGSIVVTYPASHVARGLGDVSESSRPLVATLWGEPRLGRTGARLADGTRITWSRGQWLVASASGSERDVSFREIGL
jgi:alpha-D-xyloside xylohydrolase